MRLKIHTRFVDKACSAMVSAIEVYNKPNFAFREETFAILALNAWELMLKAKILRDSNDKLNSIRILEHRQNKFGIKSKKLFLKRNRAGNPHTINFGACITHLEGTASKLAPEVRANLDILTELRDNSVHFITASPVLAKQAQEVASASVKNFITLAKHWFVKDFSDSIHLMLPLSFVDGLDEVELVSTSPQEQRLIDFLQNQASSSHKEDSPFAVALRIDIKIEKSNLASAAKVQITKDPDAVKMTLSEKDIRDKYPWDYGELCNRLKKRYSDFKQNPKFHTIRKPLLADERYAKSRYLDPSNTTGIKKDFYNPNVVVCFDLHYTKQ